MDKPLIISISEFNTALAQLVNSYLNEIPAIVMINSVSDIQKFLEQRADADYEKAKQEYEESEVNADG
jgi:hypothetical protein